MYIISEWEIKEIRKEGGRMSNLNYLPQHTRLDHPLRRRKQEQWEREEILANICFMGFMLWMFTIAMLPYLYSQI